MRIRKRIQEIDQLLSKIERNEPLYIEDTVEESVQPIKNKGISVIVPLYKSRKYLHQLIENINTFRTTTFEVIFVLNGDKDSVEEDRETLNSLTKEFTYHIIESGHGASIARNKGIEIAQYSHTLFLDADDTLHPHTLFELSKHLDFANISVFHLYNVHNEEIEQDNIIEKEKNQLKGQLTSDYMKLTKILSMNGAKLIPTHYLKTIRFDETLTSGEDVVLMTHIIARFRPLINVIDSTACVYYRHLTEHSVSRQSMSYAFNVTDRISVIQALAQLLDTEDDISIRQFIMNRMDAQAGFINRYLHHDVTAYQQVIQDLQRIHAEYLPYQTVNKGLAQTLYIGYCFAPYNDTSGVILGKRIAERKVPADVISNNMSDVRTTDYTLNELSDPYIAKHYGINSKSSFSNYQLMNVFVQQGTKKLRNNTYKEIYSRVLWPASHLLAWKLKTNNTKWIAEFSDPVLYDIKNKERHSKVPFTYVNRIKRQAPAEYHPYIDNNLYNLVELLPFIFADEIVFTNNKQRTQMIKRFTEDIQQSIIKKSVIRPHPTLCAHYYEKQRALITVDKATFNIGYFGNFYETRGLKEIQELIDHPELIEALNLSNLPLAFHIFTSSPASVRQMVSLYEMTQVNVHEALPYFEFLNATKQFDALIVMDAHTKGIKEENPYLPSKLSDYKGSGVPVIAYCEKGSPMDEMESIQGIKIRIKEDDV
ncbi:glycosyltransferase [Macrococcus psychrotolerans]|uniref:Glycosyltransferase n=1 Tax=Macrococcus psychrotolerans TaxID=3039389 RepID=A0AAT9P757_9STAP|nr:MULTISPECIES: glycosyltransferase [Macrococcus]QYA33530.1 glycosyltransferase [Macrococcus sp. 19Msa1099]QYA38350.1 glycosyltransferase [Macrococcus caseolyticus]QYA77057.1 glycosyltransferase [Macrococcus caseolyticus]